MRTTNLQQQSGLTHKSGFLILCGSTAQHADMQWMVPKTNSTSTSLTIGHGVKLANDRGLSTCGNADVAYPGTPVQHTRVSHTGSEGPCHEQKTPTYHHSQTTPPTKLVVATPKSGSGKSPPLNPPATETSSLPYKTRIEPGRCSRTGSPR